jgi:putative hydrolases of HD superfamily
MSERTMQTISGALEFLRHAEALKSTLRTGRTASGRQESTAEHSWRLCLMVMVLADLLDDIDVLKLMKMCVIHDLGEAIGGDIAAPMQTGTAIDDKRQRERRDLETLTAALDASSRQEILSLWNEYEEGATAEAKLAKAFDKLETILQHSQGLNGDGFDYAFNLSYGKSYTSAHPLTVEIRRLLDKETVRRIA